jgi:hypothetical protein
MPDRAESEAAAFNAAVYVQEQARDERDEQSPGTEQGDNPDGVD